MQAANLRKNIWFVLVCLALIMLFFQFILGRLVQLALEGFEFHPDWNDISFAIVCVREPCIAIFALVAIGNGVRRKISFRGISLLHLLLVITLVPPVCIVAGRIHGLSKAIVNDLNGEPPQQLVDLIDPPNVVHHTTAQMQTPHSFIMEEMPWWLLYLIGAAYPAIAEEICYRGLVGRLALARFGLLWGVLLSSAFFGVMHMELDRIPYAAVYGLITHTLFLFTKTILAPILFHFLINASLSTFPKLRLEMIFLPVAPDGNVPISPILVAVAAIALIALLFLFYQTQVTWMTPDGQIWTPGYPSAEMPPQDLNARATFVFRPAVCMAVAVLYLSFLGLFAANVPTWLTLNDYWQLLAEARAKKAKGDYEGAIAECDQAIQIVPDDARPYLDRGFAYQMLRKYDKAIADFNEAIRLNSKSALAYESRGNAFRANEDYDKAITDYTEAIRLDPKNVFAYNNRGWTWYLENDLDKAIADYTEVIRLDPKWVLAFINRGYAYSLKNDYGKAIADYTEAIRLDSKQLHAYSLRGKAEYEFKKYENAIATWQTALKIDPDYSWAMMRWAHLLATCPENEYRDGKKALDLAKKALTLERNPEPEFHEMLAAVFAESGDFVEAVRWQEKALADPQLKNDAAARRRLEFYRAKKPYRQE